MTTGDWKNTLYFGDNLDILRDHVPDQSIDLIYLDPPFNSNATYNVLFKEASGEGSAAQIRAFDDTWHWSIDAEHAYREVVTEGPKRLADLLQAMRGFLGQNDMMAYLTMMAQRMAELHRVLKPTGSIYLHCDPTASHYLKLLMDATYGPENLLNEVIWYYRGLEFPGSPAQGATTFSCGMPDRGDATISIPTQSGSHTQQRLWNASSTTLGMFEVIKITENSS